MTEVVLISGELEEREVEGITAIPFRVEVVLVCTYLVAGYLRVT